VIDDNKAVVRELVDRAMNANEPGVVERLCSPQLALKLVTAFSEFRAAFPDWHQELLELVAEGDRVVARFRCTGTHQGAWQGLAPTGRTMRVDEVYFFRFRDGVISGMWGLEDTWTRMRQLAGDDATLGELGSLS
jgi:predicted ester cyclase